MVMTKALKRLYLFMFGARMSSLVLAGDMAFPKNLPDQVNYVLVMVLFTSPIWLPVYGVLWYVTYIARGGREVEGSKARATVSALIPLISILLLSIAFDFRWVILGVLIMYSIFLFSTNDLSVERNVDPEPEKGDTYEEPIVIKQPLVNEIPPSPMFQKKTWIIGMLIVISLVVIMMLVGFR